MDVDTVIKEYVELGHAEPVPISDLNKDHSNTYYMPIHVVYKQSSTTATTRAAFDASAKPSTGVSLNDTLQVGILLCLGSSSARCSHVLQDCYHC